MRRFVLSTVFLLASICAYALAEAPPGERRATLHWRMSLAPDGHITALVAKGSGIEVLRPKLEQVIRTWEFAPGSVEGRAAATETMLSVQVALTPSPDKRAYTVTIKDARTGGGIGTYEPSKFSARAVRKLMGRSNTLVRQIVVEVSYDPAGKVTNVAVAESSPVSDGPLLEGMDKALRQSRFEPERVGGVGIAGRVLMPSCIVITNGLSKAIELTRDCSWSLPGSEARVEQGESLALESSVQLKTKVVGSLL